MEHAFLSDSSEALLKQLHANEITNIGSYPLVASKVNLALISHALLKLKEGFTIEELRSMYQELLEEESVMNYSFEQYQFFTFAGKTEERLLPHLLRARDYLEECKREMEETTNPKDKFREEEDQSEPTITLKIDFPKVCCSQPNCPYQNMRKKMFYYFFSPS